MKKNIVKVAISHGDVNGVGYEIIMKTLLDPRIIETCTPIIYGSSKVAAYHKKVLDIQAINFNNIKDAQEADSKKINLINCIPEELKVELGLSTVEAGEASVKSLNFAVDDLINNKVDVLVTAPINKENVQSKDFSFNGHTEFLQSKTKTDEVLMLMVSDMLKVGIVTNHSPLSKVASEITKDLIVKKLKILNKSLIEDFGVRKPKIAVLGLNPHAGDSGLLGKEEIDIIMPAINLAKEENILAFGPYAADGFFGKGNYNAFDAVLAMYHDQGLAPFKALSFDNGVNYTAGLPVIRTSPSHGTAYDLAGKNEASPDSFRQAIYLACDIYKNRMLYKEINKNPLPFSESRQGNED
ncbi:MAG TPA: 4-hydroxythreonine-4-phosphate dehydrogenase PdxA [Bacteroidales bacterium]|nr:MAG: 4-hydroxythreonine-4-phosphate dehydrogenase PdxA [Bacteroidetes bacterium GWF2_33_38]OFY74838.1 MAG: 4-hydroxythreonine-4-phosphate dehydrogenase PdxA [Bacteroidetes bacterium RIFOXYA12_FULL_33_9]OFY85910.1 MAG: 4-hydroxythreonine-4-phosphate dehydrogenase PdxA [Bacteroidetes bacterium RIFOXYA2_FULL_33_7]HBF88832.1 4-hydroxythreonine-4-phosphate dehydrogenase PdxA [Bacteroidales bacterium]